MSQQEQHDNSVTREFEGSSLPGFVALPLNLLWIAAMFPLAAAGQRHLVADPDGFTGLILASIIGAALGIVALCGYCTLQPNEARVMILFGSYKGTVRRSGFHWANPLYSRRRNSGGKSAADHVREAAMVSNLLVVLCGNNDASPVITTGTLYT
jgi:hypothetical protein